MEKPRRPVEPDFKDYKDEILKGGNVIDSPFILAYQKYQKDFTKFEADNLLYQQIKFIEDIKRSDIKLCLKKYRVIAKEQKWVK